MLLKILTGNAAIRRYAHFYHQKCKFVEKVNTEAMHRKRLHVMNLHLQSAESPGHRSKQFGS